ncbi:MAG TPA: condensation domain-containing protein, partial [Polyangiaceae bacterium]
MTSDPTPSTRGATRISLTSVDFDPFATPALLRTAASTESQREVWTASRLGSDASCAFNESISVRLRGRLDRAALEAAYVALVAAHEVLHTSFGADGTSLCVEQPNAHVAFDDLSALPEVDRADRVEAERRRQVTEPFDLAKAPLVRARLLVLSAEDHLLLLSAHHIVCDGWSMAVLLQDLADLYSQAASGAAPALPERPRFTRYADEERQRAASDEHRASERWWLDRFAGEIPVIDLPGNRSRPPLKTYASDRVDHVLDATIVARAKELGSKRGASFFVTLLAVFEALVHRLTGAHDLVVGIPAAGQAATHQPTLVGHCVNMLPLRTAVAPEMPFAELLAGVRRTMLDAYEHQAVTFGALVQKLAVKRDASRLPLINVTFNVDQATTGDDLRFAGIRAEVATTPRAFETFDLFVNAAEKHGTVTLEAQFNTDLFDRATIERWLASFEVLL